LAKQTAAAHEIPPSTSALPPYTVSWNVLWKEQCRLDAQRRSQQSACGLDALVNAALEGEKLEEFDFFEQ